MRVRPTGLLRVAGAEAVPVPAVGLQALDLDVDRVRRARGGRSPCRGGPRAGIARRAATSQRDLDGLGRHPAARLQRLGRQPGPEHHAVAVGVAGGDAEGERRGVQVERLGRFGPCELPRGQGTERGAADGGEETASAEPGDAGFGE